MYIYIYIYVYVYINIYIYIYYVLYPAAYAPGVNLPRVSSFGPTPNLPTNIVEFGGLDSSTISILRGGIPRPIGIS